jgi:hypothetical protein
VADIIRRLRAADLHLPLLLGGLAAALTLETIMFVSFVGGLHQPKPHQVPLAVAGPASAVRSVAARIESASQGAIDADVVPNEAAVNDAIQDRKVYGGIVVAPERVHLVVADAASPLAPEFLEEFFRRVAAVEGSSLQVTHVKELPPGDPRGLSPFYLIVGLLFGGYFGATILSVLGGTSSPSHLRAAGRMLLLAAYAAVSGAAAAIVADPIFGALTGNFGGLFGVAAFTIFAAAAATAGLQSLLGMPGTAVALICLILIGNPSSGGPVTNEFLPGFWRAVGPWLPGGAGTDAIRNVVYFDGAGLGRSFAVLGAYALTGSVLAIAVGWRRTRTGDPEIELASAAAV